MSKIAPKADWILHPEEPSWRDNDLTTGPGEWEGGPITIELPTEAELAGIELHWGRGFAKKASVWTSLDGSIWQFGATSSLGEGRMDLLLFGSRPARWIRLEISQPGNVRGLELTEIDLLGPTDIPRCSHPEALDGDRDTYGTVQAGETITATFPKPVEFASLRIDWGNTWATAYTVEISLDGEQWDYVGEILTGSGSFDNFYWRFRKALHLRVHVTGTSAPEGAKLTRLWFRLTDRDRRPISHLAKAAARHRWGLYPPSLQDRQVYWTLVGTAPDQEECLFDEFGNLELGRGKPMLMPYLRTKGEILSLCDAAAVTHSLDDRRWPSPSVEGHLGAFQFRVSAEAHSRDTRPVSITYQVTNTSAETQSGQLILALRPMQLNPEWQHGGWSPIDHLGFHPDGTITDQGRELLQLIDEPDHRAVSAWNKGDVMEHLLRGEWGNHYHGQNRRERLESCAVGYDFTLAPGTSRTWTVRVPLDDRHHQGVPWVDRVGPRRIEVPDQRVTDTVATQIPLILINQNGQSLQPGSRNYDRTWIRDGSHQVVTLLQSGLVEEPLEYLRWYAQSVLPDGLVPPILNPDGTVNTGHGSNLEYDAQGQFVFAVAEAFRLTRDHEFLRELWPIVKRGLGFLERLEVHHKDPRFDGLLAPSISHEGYSKPTFSYWDDFWGIRGWADAASLADAIGDAETASWARASRTRLANATRRSMAAVARRAGLDTVPSSAENADFDPTSTSIAFWPCECAEVLPQPLVQASYDRLMGHIRAREGTTAWRTTPYEIRNLSALWEMGREEDAMHLMHHMLDCQRPAGWNHWAEVIIGEARYADYIGDMPHTWIGSEFCQAIRRMFVQERGTELRLLPHVPASWREGTIRLTDLPTHFGLLNLEAADGDVRWELQPSGHPEPSRVIVPKNWKLTGLDR